MRYIFLLLLSIHLYAYERIIALSPSINEIIFALGQGDKIVGNTNFCNYPEESKKKTKVGGYFSPNLEKILSLEPDIVIMMQQSKSLAKKLNKLGIKTKLLKLTTLKDIQTSITQIGKILEEKEKAQIILNTIQERLSNLKGIISNKKILIVIGAYSSLEKRVFVVGQNLYLDDIIVQSGNVNALQSKRKGQPVLNMENIIATNPDIVILLSPYRKSKNLSKDDLIQPWLKLPIQAAKNKTIFVEDNEYAGISSHRLVYFLDDLKEYLSDVKNR